MRLPTAFIDVFCCLVGMFLLFNAMSLAYFNENPEKRLPPVELAQAKSLKGSGVTEVSPLHISVGISRGNKKGYRYFVEDKETTFGSLLEMIKEYRGRGAELRIDTDVRYGELIRLMTLCKQAGIKDISFAYKEEN